jgi:adenosylcobinamide amidohydrolase
MSARPIELRTLSHLALPWRWHFTEQTLVIALPPGYRALGWAPLGGGLKHAAAILNHQIALDDRTATDAAGEYLSRLARSMGLAPRRTIAMMTGASVRRGGFASMRRAQLGVSAWCSAGCSNALRVGDRATAARSAAGTINIAVAVSRALTIPAFIEAIQIAVEARVLAIQQAAVLSSRSGLQATGTGTDCVVVAAPDGSGKNRGGAIDYCGKHTVAGELIGRAVLKSCAQALSRCAGNSSAG